MWSLEEKLIINCLLSSPTVNPFQGIPEKQIDWNSFMEQTSRHGLSGLLYSYSQHRESQNIFPPDVSSFLKKKYYENIVQNLFFLKELQRILCALDKKGVNPLFIQGAALLLAQVYPSLGMRPLTDIDFLIEPTQPEIVGDALKELGYSCLLHYPNLLSLNGIVLDIHIDIANLERIEARKYAVNISNSSLWQEARVQEGSWGAAYVLSPEDLIITSAAHLQKHSYSRLIWFIDIVNGVKQYKGQFNWPKVMARAREFNVQKPLYFTLTFIQEVLGYNLSLQLTDELLDEKLNLVEEKFLAGLLTGNKLERAGDLLYFCSIKTVSKKILFLKENIFPKREVMAQVFGFSNPLVISFCYPVRFFQSLWYGIKMLVSSLEGLKARSSIK